MDKKGYDPETEADVQKFPGSGQLCMLLLPFGIFAAIFVIGIICKCCASTYCRKNQRLCEDRPSLSSVMIVNRADSVVTQDLPPSYDESVKPHPVLEKSNSLPSYQVATCQGTNHDRPIVMSSEVKEQPKVVGPEVINK